MQKDSGKEGIKKEGRKELKKEYGNTFLNK